MGITFSYSSGIDTFYLESKSDSTPKFLDSNMDVLNIVFVNRHKIRFMTRDVVYACADASAGAIKTVPQHPHVSYFFMNESGRSFTFANNALVDNRGRVYISILPFPPPLYDHHRCTEAESGEEES